MIDYITNKLLAITLISGVTIKDITGELYKQSIGRYPSIWSDNERYYTTYKFLCVKNKYFNDKYECIKCNNFEDFEDEKKYWINKDCKIKIFEINKCISEYRNILPYELGHLYDWTRTDIYRGYPRRPT